MIVLVIFRIGDDVGCLVVGEFFEAGVLGFFQILRFSLILSQTRMTQTRVLMNRQHL